MTMRIGLILGLISGASSFATANDDEADVLRKIHVVNQTEIAAGQLAEQKGESLRTKNFGRQLVKDHEDADKKVLTLARQEGVNLDSQESEVVHVEKQKQAGLISDLEAMRGISFDHLFLERMAETHTEMIDSLEAAKKRLSGTRTARLIDQLLQPLRNHEQMAKMIEQAE